MPILDIQRQMRELGRIRTGTSVPGDRGFRRPKRLETFRLTSPSRSLIEAAAEVYGGVIQPWGDAQWEVVTGSATLDIVVPPGMAVSSWYELWSAAGCERRCDGQTNVLTMAPCLCPPDTAERVAAAKRGEACKATTRLAVILPAIPDLGVWRLESHGYYAASELAGAADVLAAAAVAGILIRARLRLEQRTKKVPGKPTSIYTVPVIEFDATMTQIAGDALPGGSARPLGPGVSRVPQLPATTLPPTSDLRGPDDEGISVDALTAGLADLHVTIADARVLADDAYGPGPLTPGQRRDLLERLQARARL